MKFQILGKEKIIMANPDGLHNYFAWPTVSRLQNGKIAVVASGFRIKHVCPFGKVVISYSEDEGETYTAPAPIIDTPLDDRDAGVLSVGESGVIVTSFNNTVDFQREQIKIYGQADYRNAYLDMVSAEQEEKYLGSVFKISFDCGVTFGKLFKSPVTSPHGPLVTKNGKVIWVGTDYKNEKNGIKAYSVEPDGSMEYLGAIENAVFEDIPVNSCEPYAIELDDGMLLCHFRVEGSGVFTLYQSISADGGKTWTKPEILLDKTGGAPAHIIKHSSGKLISVYGYRNQPYGIKFMVSEDGGKTWDKDNVLYTTETSYDLGYPSTVELSDGSLITVFYTRLEKDGNAVIMQQKWRMQ